MNPKFVKHFTNCRRKCVFYVSFYKIAPFISTIIASGRCEWKIFDAVPIRPFEKLRQGTCHENSFILMIFGRSNDMIGL